MLIGIGYRKRSGKDTVADHLVANHGFTKLSWADALKRGCMEFFDWTEEHVYGDLKEVVDPRWGFTPRHGLQHVGTELFRNWIEDFWVRRALMALPEGHVVIPDVRFPNEAQAIHDNGGKLWLIDRPSLGPPDDKHASETALIDYGGWDSVITNDKTLNHLFNNVNQLVEAACLERG